MMKQKIIALASFFLILAFASLACSIFVGGPEYPAQPIPFSTEEVETMSTQIEQAFIAGAETGVVTIQMTESQLTSYMTAKMLQMTSPPFTDPQVILRNGQMQMYGKITRGIFTANILISMNLGIDPTTGMPSISVATADFGPFPTPEGLNKAISALLAEAFTGTLGPVATGFRIETIAIADGVLTMTGRIK